jgi:hypothetical protein
MKTASKEVGPNSARLQRNLLTVGLTAEQQTGTNPEDFYLLEYNTV